LAARLTRRDLARKTVLTALDDIGVSPASAEQTTTAGVADSVAARHLDVELSAPLLCVQQLIRDHDGQSIEHQSHLFRADRFYFRAEISIERTADGLVWSKNQAGQPLPAWL
jgi:DNA-binding GntR family transcriptional regulator